ncbi:MAG: ABC transporter ATP-binding protein [Desulfurococcus sp.]|nr:ABC transporter ATP-binding protein [Desulfurococcus sp.]
MPSVRLVDVVKKYGRVTAVDNVSLTINDGEFFAILGSSGCGKTTTLRLIAGLEYPDEGRIFIGDEDVTELHPKDRNVAMVFQNYALYPHMTVYENIAFPLEIRKRELKLTSDDIKRMVLETARFLGIEGLLDRKPAQLSGGQQQRVALARALVRKPKVWLLDEPLSNLDAKLRLTMRTELKKLQKTLNITTVYVTHDQIEALTMADRIAVMDKGRVKQVGTPSELYYKPADMFVAGFIGVPPINFIRASFRKLSEAIKSERGIGITQPVKTFYMLEAHGLKVPVDPKIGELVEAKGISQVVIGIRPQQVKIAGDTTISDTEGEVVVAEPTGSETIVTVKLGEEYVRIHVPGSLTVEMGSKVKLSFEWDKALIFDEKTESLIA